MQKTKLYKAYSNATQTVAKTRQIVMLYEAAIRNLQQAKEAIEEKRIEDRFKLLTKAADIVYGLQGCLDFEKGGDVARVLFDFYSSMDARIISLHTKQDPALCEQLIKELKSMRDVWEEIDKTGENDSVSDEIQEAHVSSNVASGESSQGGITISA